MHNNTNNTDFDITPNSYKMAESMRYLSYTNSDAIADIIDNSLDAGAENIIVSIDKNDSVIIHDDGCGMDFDTMIEALRFGSDTGKDTTELGRFGMGLNAASLSIGRRIEVVSRADGDIPNKLVFDLGYIEDTGEWRALQEPLTEMEAKTYKSIEHGTTVKICMIDSWDATISSVINDLRRIFRRFIIAGRKIVVNGVELTPVDPLFRREKDTKILLDKDIEVGGKSFHITAVHIDTDKSDLTVKNAKKDGTTINQYNEGFYIVRNNREIAGGETLKMFERHPSFNRFRCEISINGDMDKEFGINFKKKGINPIQSLYDKINQETASFRNAIRSQAKIEEKVNKSEKIDHSDAMKIITRKKSLISKTWKEKRNSPKPKDENTVTPNDDKNTPEDEKKKRVRKNIKKIQPGDKAMAAEITEADLGDFGPMFDCYFEGNRIVIRWNIKHPFHSEVVSKYSGDKNVLTPIDLFIYVLARQYIIQDEDSDAKKALSDLISTISNDLKTLM